MSQQWKDAETLVTHSRQLASVRDGIVL